MSLKKFLIAKTQISLMEKEKFLLNNSSENIITDIINFITKSSIESSFSWKKWNIGLTVYPNQEKREQGKPKIWKSWKANSASDALKIQNYFINKYPINLNRKNGSYDYFIYVFMK